MRVTTSTPGFTAGVYARNTNPPMAKWPDPGWVQVAPQTKLGAHQVIHLSTANEYRYYLLWITSLGGRNHLQLNEIALYSYK